mgnify:CR=1 FL=1
MDEKEDDVFGDDFEWIADCLRVLAHPARIRILEELERGSRCVNDLSEIIGLSQPNLSQHLGLLKNKGWIKREKKAVYVYYSLSEERISKTLREVCKIIRCFK